MENGKVILGIQAAISQKCQIVIYDILGKEIHKEELTLNRGANLKEVYLNNITKGIYILNIRTESGDTAQFKLQIN